MMDSGFEETRNTQRMVLGNGIRYNGRIYWHPELVALIGKPVLIVPDSKVDLPKSVEVFDDRKRICIATSE